MKDPVPCDINEEHNLKVSQNKDDENYCNQLENEFKSSSNNIFKSMKC